MEEEVLKGRTLLVVDDEVDLRDIVASELEFMGGVVYQAENILRAQEILKTNKIDLIVSDIRMPGGTGIDLLQIVKKDGANSPAMILITGFADITLEDALDKGAEAMLSKPFKLDDLIRTVVRFTTPIEERFLVDHHSQQSLQTLKGEGLRAGRGGIVVDITDQGKRYEVGEIIEFDLTLEQKQLKGFGLCRWIRLRESDRARVYLGLEFLSLGPDSLKSFQEILGDRKIVPYIPNIPD